VAERVGGRRLGVRVCVPATEEEVLVGEVGDAGEGGLCLDVT
jgi:hypothetical protein